MWPRSLSGRSVQVVNQLSSAPAKSGTTPGAPGNTSLIRWSYHGCTTPSSVSSGPPSSTRTKLGDSRVTARTSTVPSSRGSSVAVLVMTLLESVRLS